MKKARLNKTKKQENFETKSNLQFQIMYKSVEKGVCKKVRKKKCVAPAIYLYKFSLECASPFFRIGFCKNLVKGPGFFKNVFLFFFSESDDVRIEKIAKTYQKQ